MGAFAIIIPLGKFTMHVWFIAGLVWHLFSCSFTVWLFAFISSMVIPILSFIISMVNPILSLYMFALFSSFSELISCSFNSFDSGPSFSLRIGRSAGWIVKQKGLFSEDEPLHCGVGILGKSMFPMCLVTWTNHLLWVFIVD